MQNDIYLLIANHLKDIHHLLEDKIMSSKTNSPKWTIQKVENIEMVVELSSLFGVANLLEKLAGSAEQPPPLIYDGQNLE